MPEPNSMPRARNSSTAALNSRRPQAPGARQSRRTVTIPGTASQESPRTLLELNRAISAARPLVPGAMHAVLGEGPVGAAIAFVGEQPGDQEDLQGRPFVGPAGQLLNRAMSEAGIDRNRSYLTNAVKHFKFEQRGKRRIHQKPTAGEVRHYRWWLNKELTLVHPRLIVALGATAVLALAGKALPIARFRGKADFAGRLGYITVHPSFLLRIPDAEAKRQAYEEFIADLRAIRALVRSPIARQAL
jgi:uracil-DNA glycosylase family protein